MTFTAIILTFLFCTHTVTHSAILLKFHFTALLQRETSACVCPYSMCALCVVHFNNVYLVIPPAVVCERTVRLEQCQSQADDEWH